MLLIFILKKTKMKDKQESTGELKKWLDTSIIFIYKTTKKKNIKRSNMQNKEEKKASQIIFIFKTTKMKNMRRRSVEKKEKKKVWQEQARRGNQVEKQRQEI